MTLALSGFAGRTAMVWGGGAGIGAATTRLLAQAGARVAIADSDIAAARAVAEELSALGTQACAIEADVRSEQSVEAAIDSATATLGIPTLSANVVGVAGWSDLLSMTADMWDEQQALNLRPMFLIGRGIARGIRDSGQDGAMVFTGSIAGQQGARRHAAYGAAKAGMVALAKSMALEWGPLGIRVNCLAPGPIATVRIQPSEQMQALFARKIPAGRFGTVDEVAQGLVWLLSDQASFITGETLFADGGWMASAPVGPEDNPALPA